MFFFYHQFGPAGGYLLAALSLFLRYALVAGGAWFLFYQMKRGKWWHRKIQLSAPRRAQILLEIRHSLATIFIFALIGGLLYFFHQQGWTRLYLNIEERGWPYLFFSALLLILLHDTYFYWMHRLVHRPRWFNWVHAVHHLSRNPTPWAALCFHPLEALLELAVVPVAVFVLPLHPLALGLFGVWALVWNVVGHLGFELFPSGFTRHPVFRWFNTSTHHNLHHRYGRCNYGLYFNFWDTLLQTNHPRYHEIFEGVTGRKERTLEPVPSREQSPLDGWETGRA